MLPDILPSFVPYTLVLAAFGAFVVWNGGIVLGKSMCGVLRWPWLIEMLGDKSNHIPALHIPQLYYFIAAATFFGWPALASGSGGALGLMLSVKRRMFGSPMYVKVAPASWMSS